MAGTPATYVPQSQIHRSAVEAIAADVRAQFPAAWAKCLAPGDDGEYNERVAWACQQAGVPAWLNGKRGNPNDPSHDILLFENPTGARDTSGRFAGVELIDFIPSHESPAAGFGWGDVTVVPGPPPSMPDGCAIQPRDLGGGEAPAPTHDTERGVTLFWAHAACRDGGAELERFRKNVEAASTTLNARYVRWFMCVGGDYYSGVDPWQEVGAFFDAPQHYEHCVKVVNVLKEFGLRSHLTLTGSRSQSETDSQRNAICDRAARLVAEVGADHFKVIETHNEYRVNGSESHDCRNMARRLRGQVPAGFPIALSSPDSVMGSTHNEAEVKTEIEKLYSADCGGNVLTWHETRPPTEGAPPLPYWDGVRMKAMVSGGNFPSLGVPQVILSGEPIGPGSSVYSTTDPGHMAAMNQRAIDAGASGWTWHSMPGVWGGRCYGTPSENQWANIWEVPNFEAQGEALRGLDAGLAPPQPIPPTPQPGPEPLVNHQLLPGQSLLPGDGIVSPTGRACLQYQHDGNLVIYLDGVAFWSAHTDGATLGSLQMQVEDGNLVLYSATAAIRWSGTNGHLGAMAQLNDDGNLVIYADPNGPQAGTPLWSSMSDVFHGAEADPLH